MSILTKFLLGYTVHIYIDNILHYPIHLQSDIVQNLNQTTTYIGNLAVMNMTTYILNVIALTESGDESEKQNLKIELCNLRKVIVYRFSNIYFL